MARVLIVDDDPDILNLVQFQLRHHGHKVVTAGSAGEAESVLEERGVPDAVVLDVMMPDVTGFELLTRLRERDGFGNVPAIFLSARVLPDDIERGTAFGAQYLTKPFIVSALLAAIDRAITAGPADAGEW